MACTVQQEVSIQMDGMCDGSKLNILPVVLKPRWTLTSEDDFRRRTIEERLPYVRFCRQIPDHGGTMLLQAKGEEVHPVRVCHHGNVVTDTSSRGTQYACRSANRNGASRLLPLLYSPENRHQHSKTQGAGARGFNDTAIINNERLLSLIENDEAFAAVRTCSYNNNGDNRCGNSHLKHSGDRGGTGPGLRRNTCSECNPGVNPRSLTAVTHVAMPNQIVKCSRLLFPDENKDCLEDGTLGTYNRTLATGKNKMATVPSPRKRRGRYTNRTAVEQDYSNVISELRFRDGSLRMRHYKARKRYREQMDQVVHDFKAC